uniref:Uncharacterized protein n=1 Tax=Tephrocybe rancida TaxID=117070 RepID=A0A386TY73_9AGAR|nr:hypothetical protein DXG01_000019 [Tephrocybe rancida]AYE93174.1 hypothetical protein DXG01_000019 [Tephrocybe rancida]
MNCFHYLKNFYKKVILLILIARILYFCILRFKLLSYLLIFLMLLPDVIVWIYFLKLSLSVIAGRRTGVNNYEKVSGFIKIKEGLFISTENFIKVIFFMSSFFRLSLYYSFLFLAVGGLEILNLNFFNYLNLDFFFKYLNYLNGTGISSKQGPGLINTAFPTSTSSVASLQVPTESGDSQLMSLSSQLSSTSNNLSSLPDPSTSVPSSPEAASPGLQNSPTTTQTSLNTNNFNSLSLEEKREYIRIKFYNRGVDSNLPYLDWFLQKTSQTDGSISSVDSTIDQNLSAILKIEREAKLNSHATTSLRPFLRNKTYNSPTSFPNWVPFKPRDTYDG